MTSGPDMDCVELVELVNDYLEHVLDDRTCEQIEQHLTICGGCRAYLDQVRTTIRLSGHLETSDVPAPMLDALTAAFRARFAADP